MSRFCPVLGTASAIPPGPVTAAQLRQMIPHDGKVVTMRLSGARIIEILEQAIDNVFSDDPAGKVGGMIQLSGLRIKYSTTRPKGHRIIAIERTQGKWNTADDCVVATNSMLAEGGHNQETFLRSEKIAEHGSQYELIKRALQRESPRPRPVHGPDYTRDQL